MLLILYALHHFLAHIDKRMLLGKALDYVGKNSIIVYASNILAMFSKECLALGINDSLEYWTLQIVWYIVLYYANKCLLAKVAVFVEDKVGAIVCKLRGE